MFSMNESEGRPGPLLRIGYSFVGLLAGNLALLVLLLGFFVRNRIALPPNHGPALSADVENALSMMAIYAIFSVFGWVLIGIPAVLAIPPRTLLRLSWWVLVPAGVVLGPASLLLIFSLMGHLSPRIFTEGRLFFLFAGVVSGVAFWVHCLLLRRQSAG